MKKKVWIWALSMIGLSAISVAVFYFIKIKPANEFADDLGEMGILVQKVSEQKLGESILVTGKLFLKMNKSYFWILKMAMSMNIW